MTSNFDISDAARALRDGALVGFPTETVYGLGADATSPEAVARVFAAKGRPSFNPLIAHVASPARAKREAIFTSEAETLAARFWPGPLTLVLKRSPSTGTICDLACAGLASVGLRIPSHPIALALLEAVDRPIAAPSANMSGRLSPTRAADVRDAFGKKVEFVLDGGDCEIGVESTIVACLDGRVTILRHGGVSSERIEAAIGRPPDRAGVDIQAPGMLASHYAPNAALRLDATGLRAGETGLDFGGVLGASVDLSPTRDLREAAANLYRRLRQLDETAATIAVAPIPRHGLGAAINDRLCRAAAPRAT